MIVVVDCSHISQTDFTAAEGFQAMLADFKQRGQLVYWQATNQGVVATLRAIMGEELKLIQGPIELGSSKQESPKPVLSNTEMKTISEETGSAVLRKNSPKEIPKSFATFY